MVGRTPLGAVNESKLCRENFFAICSFACGPYALEIWPILTPSPYSGARLRPHLPKQRLRPLNRSQWRMLNIDVERLIPDDHAARAIWDLWDGWICAPSTRRSRRWKGI